MDVADARQLWAPDPGYLDTASYGLPPTPAWNALQEALAGWRTGRGSWEAWTDATGQARTTFARLVGVDVDQVVVGSIVSELLGLVAAGLPERARVVVPEVEFTSNLFPWLVQAERGVEIETVPLDRLVESIVPGTTAVAVGLVQSSTGEIAALDEVLEAADAVDALVIVDATQAVGWLPVDASRVDALVCGAYKWLMAPRGTAFMTLSERLQDWLRPVNAGWFAGEDVHTSYYGPPLRLAKNARRFDISPAWFNWVGTAPSLEVIEQVGVDVIHEHDVRLANRFRAGLGLPAYDSAIVSAQLPDAGEKLRAAGIRVAARAGSLRASFHIYTTEADVDAALDVLVG